MKYLPFLFILSLLFSCDDASGDATENAAASAKSATVSEEKVAPVAPALPEVATPTVAPETIPEAAPTLTQFHRQYGVDSICGLVIEDCSGMLKDPRLRTASPGDYEPSVVPEGKKPLLCYELFPGEFLVAWEYVELTTYVELQVVDSLLRPLYRLPVNGCGEPDQEEVRNRFVSDTVFETTYVDHQEDLNDTTKLYRRYTERFTLRPGEAPQGEVINQDYFVRGPGTSPVMDETFTCDLAGWEHAGARYPLPVKSLLPTNSIGVVTLEETTANAYRMTVRFPGVRASQFDGLIGAHFRAEPPAANQYTEDMWLEVSPFRLTLFDTLGKTVEVDTVSRIALRFYCENDGPMITDATVELLIPKMAYPGRPVALDPGFLRDVVSVAVAGYQPDELLKADHHKYVWADLVPVLSVRVPELSFPLVSFFTVPDEEIGLDCRVFRAANRVRDLDLSCCGP